ncbi:MAG TPA: sulfatase-like hydrolase/transferase [Chloroflexota bacterium]|nr:sulfatase-like hydrolase/transferase [Chloroflexota bacterium]
MPGTERPNILLIMSDEHAPQFAGFHGHHLVQTPHLDTLASDGVVFDSAYCNSPLCVPSRASFMAGLHLHRTGVWDNGATLPENIPTWAHMVRAAGYDAVLSGKMHLVGADNLHGFRAEIEGSRTKHPISAPRWQEPHRIGNPASRRRVDDAGVGASPHVRMDDLAEEAAVRYMREQADGATPWALCVGFILPHFPLVAPEPYFSMYYPHRTELPSYPAGTAGREHPVHERVRQTFNLYSFSDEQILRARAAYFALITYLDEKIGRLIATLEETGQRQNTVVVYTSDHGELVGEHGLWWKNSFYEHASRVPLIFSWPGQWSGGRRFAGACSLVDLTATVVDLAEATSPGNLDGDTLLPLLRGQTAEWKDEAYCEYTGHATNTPGRMLRTGRWKINIYHGEGHELFDLATDPGEQTNLAGRPELAAVERQLLRRVQHDWNPATIAATVRQSQAGRAIITAAEAGVHNADERRRMGAIGG